MTEQHALPDANPLSEREMEVARQLVTGASNAEIARDLVISPHTVKVHLRNIFEKLQVASRTEASMVLVQRGWIVVPGAVVEPAEEQGPPPLPEPAPLDPVPGQVPTWQRAYLVAALALCLLLFAAPYVGALMADSTDLLTNAEQAASAPPSARLEPRWSLRMPLRAALGRHAMVHYSGRTFMLGGETTAGTTLADVAYLDAQGDAWTPVAPLPVPLANLAAAVLGDTLFVAGGSTHQSSGDNVLSDQLFAYEFMFDQWTSVNTLPYPAAGAALVSDGSALYLIGGWDGENMRDEIWRFQPELGDEGQWELVGHLAKGRAFLGAAAVLGDIFIAGGYDGERELELLEVFTPQTGEIRELAPMATPRGGLALVYDGVALYALGGGWTRPLVNLERYDFSTNSWSNFPSPIQGEWRHLAATGLDGMIHMAGGWAGDYIDTQLDFQSSFRMLLPVISGD